jgi:hypothetical protein
MSKFIGRRFGAGGDGYTDHGQLTGLLDDDHPQYLITTAVRTLASPLSGITKTGIGAGNVFSLVNAGTGAALFIEQTGTTDAYAAAYIDNSGNDGSGLSVISSNIDPSSALVQFSATSSTFDEPILLLTHPDQHGLSLKVFGDGYLSGHIYVILKRLLQHHLESFILLISLEMNELGPYLMTVMAFWELSRDAISTLAKVMDM